MSPAWVSRLGDCRLRAAMERPILCRSRVGASKPFPKGKRLMGRVDLAGYCRRIADFDYRPKLGDVPRDMALLLELTREIEFSDKVILDSKDVGE